MTLIKNGVEESENMLQLWQQNQVYIKKIAHRFRAYEDIEDLMQQGFIGLCHAVEGYDQEEKIPFINYAAFWIRQSMRRYIDDCGSLVRVPVYARSEIYQLRRFVNSFEQEAGRRPTEREICLYTGWSHAQLRRMQKGIEMERINSLDIPAPGCESEDVLLSDIIRGDTDLEAEVMERMDAERLRAVLWGMVDELPGKCPAVVRMFYQEDAPLKEVGELIGANADEVRRIKRKAISELRKPARKELLQSFLSDAQEAVAYNTGGAALFSRSWTSSTERAALQ